MRVLLQAFALAILMPFFFGVLFAFLLPPLCWWLDRRRSALKAQPNVVPVDVAVERAILRDWTAVAGRYKGKAN